MKITQEWRLKRDLNPCAYVPGRVSTKPLHHPKTHVCQLIPFFRFHENDFYGSELDPIRELFTELGEENSPAVIHINHFGEWTLYIYIYACESAFVKVRNTPHAHRTSIQSYYSSRSNQKINHNIVVIYLFSISAF